jgi:putative ABC transport system permease protein
MVSDFKFALRLLFKQPGFTAVAVLTMALAIGLNTALFSFVNGVVLRPIDYPQPDELVRVWMVDHARNIEFPAVSWPRYEYIRDNASMLANAALTVGNAVTVTTGTDAEQVASMMATSNFFSTLGLAPQLGRFFQPEEDKTGGANVALISHHLWQTRFGGSRDVLGKPLSIDGVPHEIVGVLPSVMPVPFNQVEIIQPRPVEIPFVAAAARSGGAAVWQLTARLKPGISREAAGR